MTSIPPPPLPPACANCVTTTQLAQPGAAPTQSASSLLRSADGRMRVDTGNTSVITDPAAQKAIILDHLKKTAHTIPLPQAPSVPGMPGMPSAPGMPSVPKSPAEVEDLGKGFIEGHEVEGKKYTLHMPEPPKPPTLPNMPSLTKPQIPGMPQAPTPPAVPQPPQMPTVAEVWTSTKTKLPMLTKVTGPFGQQICQCKDVPTSEPHPAAFQIPHDYKSIVK